MSVFPTMHLYLTVYLICNIIVWFNVDGVHLERENRSAAKLESTPQPDPCGPYKCLYGRCKINNGAFSCGCDKGYIGNRCDIPCNRSCGDKGKCYRSSSMDTEKCRCIYPNYGDFCKEAWSRVIKKEKSSPTTSVSPTEKSSPTSSVSPVKNSLSPTSTSPTLRPFCGPYRCMHGRCNVNKGAYSCHCNKGYIGNRCDIPCYRDCGDNGKCYRSSSTDTETCRCTYPYYGDMCKEVIDNKFSAKKVMSEISSPVEKSSPTVSASPTEKSSPTTSVSPVESSLSPTSTSPTLRPFCGPYRCMHGRCNVNKGAYSCHCNKGYIGNRCDIPCYRDCGDNGKCYRSSSTDTETCRCTYPYYGDMCKEVIDNKFSAKKDDWKYWVVSSCAILLVVLGLLLLLAFILVKRRNIFIMQVLYYLQPYEGDDGKQFDAFVSYKSSPEDEHFVYHTLYPELERQRGFKLCLHQRDFTPGETIANNIMWAIESSRRTILVLSPRYMDSDFTRFEYQIAHDQMLKQKHKVIPLLLEDVSQQKHLMDRTLTSILESITYIEWPKEPEEKPLKKFWKRLELSLPKRNRDSESGNAEPDLATQSRYTTVPVELETISAENDEMPIEPSAPMLSCFGRDDSDECNKSITDEYMGENPVTMKELKCFFAVPHNEETFVTLRERNFYMDAKETV